MTRVRKREREIQDEMRREQRRFMGEKRFFKQLRGAWSRGGKDGFTVAPRVAASHRWLRVANLQRDREWEAEYAEALEELLAGGDPEFPPGTYWLRRFAGVRVRSTTDPP